MPLSLNCFDDGNIIDGKRMFILIKLMFMMIFMVNGSVAASKTEKNNELNNELFPIDFILFSAHDLKKQCRIFKFGNENIWIYRNKNDRLHDIGYFYV